MARMIHGPTYTGNWNLLHVEDGAFVLQGNMNLNGLKKLHKELGTVIAREERKLLKSKQPIASRKAK
jgi:hypothetical protein